MLALPAAEAGGAAELGRLEGGGAADVLVLAPAGEEAPDLHEVPAERLRVVVAHRHHVVHVVPRRDRGEGAVALAAPEDGVRPVGPASLHLRREERRYGGVDRSSQLGILALRRDVEAVRGVGEAQGVDGSGPDAAGELRDHRPARLTPGGLDGGEGIVAPEPVGAGGVGSGVGPAVLRGAQHQPRPLVERVVEADVVLPPVDPRRDRVDPVGAASRLRHRVGQGIELQQEESARAQSRVGDHVPRKRPAGEGIQRSGRRAARDAGSPEAPPPLVGRRHQAGAQDAAPLAVPFLGSEEMELPLPDRAAEGPTEVVPLERLLPPRRSQEVVVGAKRRVPAEVEGAPVEVVAAATGGDVDLGPARAPELRAVAVAVDLHLGDGIHRGVDHDAAIGAGVVVVDAVDEPQVARDPAAADREVDAAGQGPLVLGARALQGGHPRHQLHEVAEVTAVERQLAHLLARDHAVDFASRRGPRRREALRR